jgi:hypothetical protein
MTPFDAQTCSRLNPNTSIVEKQVFESADGTEKDTSNIPVVA